ncbi:hypothetical protein HPB48_012703 [Haemaphysalis longicornis]|uniref:Uncharacterized protein n=1 Tax=Haemaphysalis longicornis TaxID=44386 RepID=A0A9J6G001_HAELO|nr:hypothetical protein HPB48_012703 [Haemaphysalis longicornis]
MRKRERLKRRERSLALRRRHRRLSRQKRRMKRRAEPAREIQSPSNGERAASVRNRKTGHIAPRSTRLPPFHTSSPFPTFLSSSIFFYFCHPDFPSPILSRWSATILCSFHFSASLLHPDSARFSRSQIQNAREERGEWYIHSYSTGHVTTGMLLPRCWERVRGKRCAVHRGKEYVRWRTHQAAGIIGAERRGQRGEESAMGTK